MIYFSREVVYLKSAFYKDKVGKKYYFCSMKIISSVFVKSITHYHDAPKEKPAFAMIGRSNVGKSSLINTLLGRKNLARTSAVPGKTQLINYFLINDKWFLVDLPGYGWAKTSQTNRVKWEKMVSLYLSKASLGMIFLLIDSRHPLQKIDLDFIQWLDKRKLPFALVFTKADKCKKNVLKKNIQAMESRLHEYLVSLPPFFITSAKSEDNTLSKENGCQQILAYIGLHMG